MNKDKKYDTNETMEVKENDTEGLVIPQIKEERKIELPSYCEQQVFTFNAPPYQPMQQVFTFNAPPSTCQPMQQVCTFNAPPYQPMQQMSVDNNNLPSMENRIQHTPKRMKFDKCCDQNFEIPESIKKFTQALSNNDEMQINDSYSSVFHTGHNKTSEISGSEEKRLREAAHGLCLLQTVAETSDAHQSVFNYPTYMDDRYEYKQHSFGTYRDNHTSNMVAQTSDTHQSAFNYSSYTDDRYECKQHSFGTYRDNHTSKILGSDDDSDEELRQAALGLCLFLRRTGARDTLIESSSNTDELEDSGSESDNYDEFLREIAEIRRNKTSVKPARDTLIESSSNTDELEDSGSESDNYDEFLREIAEIRRNKTSVKPAGPTAILADTLLQGFEGLIINGHKISESNSDNATDINPGSLDTSVATSHNPADTTEVFKFDGLPTASIQEAKQSKVEYCQLYEKGKRNLDEQTSDNVLEDIYFTSPELKLIDDSWTDVEGHISEISECSWPSDLTDIISKCDGSVEIGTSGIKRPRSPVGYEPLFKKPKFKKFRICEEETDSTNEGSLNTVSNDEDTGPSQRNANEEVCFEQQILKTTDSSAVLGEEIENNDIPEGISEDEVDDQDI